MTTTYGDVTREYLALRRGAGAVEAHELVWVRGPDTVRFLDGLLSQAIEPLSPGDVASALLLSPQGKLRAPLWILAGDGEIGLLTDIDSGSIIIEDLTRFKIRVDAVIDEQPQPAVDVWGPGGEDVVAQLGLEVPQGWVQSGERAVARIPFRGGGSLSRFVVVGASLDEIAHAGAEPSGSVAAAAVRVEQGEPVNLVDVDEKTIPAEAHLVDGAVDFDKGCYLGQELVARIDSRGHVNRLLRGIQITTNVVPPVGAEVVAGEKTVGRLTTVAESLDLRTPVALALIRREVEPGSSVTVTWDGGAAPAVVATLPMV